MPLEALKKEQKTRNRHRMKVGAKEALIQSEKFVKASSLPQKGGSA